MGVEEQNENEMCDCGHFLYQHFEGDDEDRTCVSTCSCKAFNMTTSSYDNEDYGELYESAERRRIKLAARLGRVNQQSLKTQRELTQTQEALYRANGRVEQWCTLYRELYTRLIKAEEGNKIQILSEKISCLSGALEYVLQYGPGKGSLNWSKDDVVERIEIALTAASGEPK